MISANVRRILEQNDLLQEDVARQASYRPMWPGATVIRLEAGQRDPSLREPLILSAVLDAPLSELVAGGDGTAELAPGVTWELSALQSGKHAASLMLRTCGFIGGAEGIRTPDLLSRQETLPRLTESRKISAKRALTWTEAQHR